MATTSRTANHTSHVVVTVVVKGADTRQVEVEDNGVLHRLGVGVVTPTVAMVAEIFSSDTCQWVRDSPT